MYALIPSDPEILDIVAYLSANSQLSIEDEEAGVASCRSCVSCLNISAPEGPRMSGQCKTNCHSPDGNVISDALDRDAGVQSHERSKGVMNTTHGRSEAC